VTLNIQALSGTYLAVFFFVHVSAALMARPITDTNFVWAAGRNGLLAGSGSALLLPYYLLGVLALFVHVGHYVRVRITGLLPEIVVQRLSYAGMALGGMVTVTIGLALCGFTIIP
jgi:succinate dehydrogenase/fumarate reductase cytochrome b subunit